MKRNCLIGFFVLAASLTLVLSCNDRLEALRLPSVSDLDSWDRNPILDITRNPANISSFESKYLVSVNINQADILLERLMNDMFWPFISEAGEYIASIISNNTGYIAGRSVEDNELINPTPFSKINGIPEEIDLSGYARWADEETDTYYRASGDSKFRLELKEGADLKKYIDDTISAIIGDIAGQGSGKIRINRDGEIETGNISISVNGAVNLGLDNIAGAVNRCAKCTFSINVSGSLNKRDSIIRVDYSIRLFDNTTTLLASDADGKEFDILDFF